MFLVSAVRVTLTSSLRAACVSIYVPRMRTLLSQIKLHSLSPFCSCYLSVGTQYPVKSNNNPYRYWMPVASERDVRITSAAIKGNGSVSYKLLIVLIVSCILGW
jgi:hypothetical protein